MAVNERIHAAICSNKNTIYTTVAMIVNTQNLKNRNQYTILNRLRYVSILNPSPSAFI